MCIDPIALPLFGCVTDCRVAVDRGTGSERINDMVGRYPSRIVALVLAIVLLLTPYLSASPAAAAACS